MKEYSMGIDVSKGSADIILLNFKKELVEKSFQLDDTSAGHRVLKTKLEIFFTNNPEAIIYAALESTGGYENNWYRLLRNLGEEMAIQVARLNPIGVKHYWKAKMEKNITDKISAKNIAEYQIVHKEKIGYSKEPCFSSLRKQWKFVRMITKQKTQFYNQLESELYLANPEMLIHCRNGVPKWVLQVLKKYPTAEKLSKAKVNILSKIPYVTAMKAEVLISNAKRSVASAGDEMAANLIVCLVEQIQSQEALIKSQMDYIEAKCELPREIEILKSFIGISTYTAIGLMLEIGTVDRFEDAKHLASYFGLHPVYKESGDGRKGVHMSKQGRSEPRALLYMAAKTAAARNPQIKEIFTKQIKQGKCYNSAIGVCMHKILRIVYGMLKNKEMYNPEKEKEYQEKITTEKGPKIDTGLRRFQPPDQSAPISRKQNKKRKEREKAQNEINSLIAGSDPRSLETKLRL